MSPGAPETSDDVLDLVVELVEKVGLLKRELEHKGLAGEFEGRLRRIDQKISALAQRLSGDTERAKALRTAWAQPARSLAFRNAAHQKGAPGDDPSET